MHHIMYLLCCLTVGAGLFFLVDFVSDEISDNDDDDTGSGDDDMPIDDGTGDGDDGMDDDMGGDDNFANEADEAGRTARDIEARMRKERGDRGAGMGFDDEGNFGLSFLFLSPGFFGYMKSTKAELLVE